MLLIIDNKHNTKPSMNLAMEEHIVRNLDQKHEYLLLYQNQPSIIIGRHQNVFEEVNTDFLQSKRLPVYRRISGGGAVYHDLGNINFSYFTSFHKSNFNNYQKFTLPVIATLNELGLSAKLNKHNAIVTNNLKISGNAQFSSKNRMMSHGTLLFNVNLENLRISLRVKQKNIQSKSRKSIPSHVTNINECLSTLITLEKLKDLLVGNYFKSQQNILYYQMGEDDWKKIRKLARKKYETWEWNFGESPKFRLTVAHQFAVGFRKIDIVVDKGRILQVTISGENLDAKNLDLITNNLKNIRYYHTDLLHVFKSMDIFPIFGDISVEELLKIIY